MIHHVVSANILPGKDKEAERFLLKIAAFVNQKFPGTEWNAPWAIRELGWM